MQSPDPVALLRDVESAGQLNEYFPELHALKMPLRPGYRHKDNWLHTLQVLDNALSLGGHDERLIIAAVTHDVGKPKTRRFGNPGVVTFQGHEVVGANMATSVLQKQGFTPAVVQDVSHLVRLHMRAFGFGDTKWSESGVRRLAHDTGGEEQMGRLLTVFRSDLTTKRADKRAKVLGGIARLEDAIEEVRSKDARKALRPALSGDEIMALTGLKPSRELGVVMKFLNSDEIVSLDQDDALAATKAKFPWLF